MPRITLSQSQPKVLSYHSDIPQSSTKPKNETGSDDSTTEAEESETENEDKKSLSSEAAKRLQEHLEQITVAPIEQQRRRRSRRLLNKEDAANVPPPASHHLHSRKSPHKKGRGRRDRRRRRKEEQVLESQVTDSQLHQVTYDNPKDRKEKEKLLARISRYN